MKKLKWDLDFSDVLIKGRSSKGNIVSKYPIKRIELKEKGVSTLKPRNIWFDEVVNRLNLDGRGSLLGAFKGGDLLLVITQKGVAKTLVPDVSLHFDEDMIVLEKWQPKKPISAIYFDGEKQKYYGKRFLIEQPNKEELFISEHPESFLEIVSTDWRPVFEIEFPKPRGKDPKPSQELIMEEFIAPKGIKALGNQVSAEKLKSISALEPLHYEEEETVSAEDMEVVDPKQASEPTQESPASEGQKDTNSGGLQNDQPTLF